MGSIAYLSGLIVYLLLLRCIAPRIAPKQEIVLLVPQPVLAWGRSQTGLSRDSFIWFERRVGHLVLVTPIMVTSGLPCTWSCDVGKAVFTASFPWLTRLFDQKWQPRGGLSRWPRCLGEHLQISRSNRGREARLPGTHGGVPASSMGHWLFWQPGPGLRTVAKASSESLTPLRVNSKTLPPDRGGSIRRGSNAFLPSAVRHVRMRPT